MTRKLFPIFLDVRDRTCVVVGGGTVAARKASALLKAGARVQVISPELGREFAPLIAGGRITHRGSHFRERHLDGAVLVFAATSKPALNARIARQGRLRGIPVNVADDPGHCSFFMPAVVDRAPVTIAISSGGASPTLARWVRARIEAMLPAGLGPLAMLAARNREPVRQHIADPRRRRRFWERIIGGTAGSHALAGDIPAAEAALKQALRAPGEKGPGEVHLVGAGPGDPELLTLKAHRLLQTADVIVYDALVPEPILELARRDARRIDAGKRKGHHAMSQSEINSLLVSLANAGNRVVRLKGGDPFIFARGGEEMAALTAAGISCHAVPGITAAAGCAAAAGFPLTHRDHASELMLVSAHGKGGSGNRDWRGVIGPGRTLAIYMGRSRIREIVLGLTEAGLDPATPVAVIENGTLPSERRLTGTLRSIADTAEQACLSGPAMIVVGAVAGLATPALPGHVDAPTETREVALQ